MGLAPIAGTSIFDLRASRRGYRLNKMCGSLCSPANREAFKRDEEAYMTRFSLSESEKQLIRSDLYLADEAFMTGTAAEVTPLRAVDDVEIGVGQITLEIQEAYLDTARGRSERWAHWLEYATPAPAEA